MDIGWRTADHPEDLARGSLSLQRLLRLVEQADVLDRNDGLVGEGLEQRNRASEKGLTSLRVIVMASIGVPSRSIGTDRVV